MKKEEFYNFYFKGKPEVPSWEEYSERTKNAVYCCLSFKNAAKNFNPKLTLHQKSNDKESFVNEKDRSTINKIKDILKSKGKSRIKYIKEFGQMVKQLEVSPKKVFELSRQLVVEEIVLSEDASISPFFNFYLYFCLFFFFYKSYSF